jgi:hypothetical protein
MFSDNFYEAGGDDQEKPEFPDLDKELELGKTLSFSIILN